MYEEVYNGRDFQKCLSYILQMSTVDRCLLQQGSTVIKLPILFHAYMGISLEYTHTDYTRARKKHFYA